MCFAYALMTEAELNFGAIYKSSMRKAHAHQGFRYAFGGLITKLCRHTCVPKDPLDDVPYIEASHYNVANINGPNVSLVPVLTIAERAHRDELIMVRMFGLEKLRHRVDGRPSNHYEFDKVEARYSLWPCKYSFGYRPLAF